MADVSDPAIDEAYQDVRSDKTDTNWLLLDYESDRSDKLKLTSTGTGGLAQLRDALDDGKASFAYARVAYSNDKESTREKFILVVWIGPQCKVMRKAKARPSTPRVRFLPVLILAPLGIYHLVLDPLMSTPAAFNIFLTPPRSRISTPSFSVCSAKFLSQYRLLRRIQISVHAADVKGTLRVYSIEVAAREKDDLNEDPIIVRLRKVRASHVVFAVVCHFPLHFMISFILHIFLPVPNPKLNPFPFPKSFVLRVRPVAALLLLLPLPCLAFLPFAMTISYVLTYAQAGGASYDGV
ncbi:putative ADF-like domain-containing protein [Mycena venus]|uniref:Putative ADF-like domain-containing protein n=1 Tax=Mycena venus TaxID=2733690 RepID=A0A8H6YKP5_9AGAR|nr:putative ADF-like domain-containing protein [Mycena venus]